MKKKAVEPDPYASVSLHGIMPLAIDRETGALRFAVLGEDEPADCLTDPSSLPAARIDLLVFRQGSHMDLWRAGLAEVAGNSVELVVPRTAWASCALLVRHDLDPRPGATLDEVVALRPEGGAAVASASSAAERFAEERRRLVRLAKEASEARRYEDDWSAEIAALRAIDRVSVDPPGRVTDASAVEFEYSEAGGILGVGPRYVLRRRADGYVVSWKVSHAELDADLSRRAAAATADSGVVLDGQVMSCGLAAIDASSLDDVRDRRIAAEAALRSVDRIAQGRTFMWRFAVDEKATAVVRKALAGYPVTANRHLAGFAQASASTGRPMELGYSHVEKALKGGLLEPVCAIDDGAGGDVVFLQPTRLAEDFVAGREKEFEEASADGQDRGRRAVAPPRSPPSRLPEAIRRAPRSTEKVKATLAAEVADLAKSRVRTVSTWATVAAAIAHGVATVGDDGRPAAV